MCFFLLIVDPFGGVLPPKVACPDSSSRASPPPQVNWGALAFNSHILPPFFGLLRGIVFSAPRGLDPNQVLRGGGGRTPVFLESGFSMALCAPSPQPREPPGGRRSHCRGWVPFGTGIALAFSTCEQTLKAGQCSVPFLWTFKRSACPSVASQSEAHLTLSKLSPPPHVTPASGGPFPALSGTKLGECGRQCLRGRWSELRCHQVKLCSKNEL